MRRFLLLLPLLLGGCSCQPDAQTRAAAGDMPKDVSAPQPQAGNSDASTVAEATDAAATLSAVAPGAASETETVRNYVYALLGGDRARSDAFWSGGRTGSRPDDHVLRGIPTLKTLRVDADVPIARDTAQPSRQREVPVRIRAVTADTTLLYHGWYRLQPRPDGSGWEITGASLQPTLR